MGRLFFHIIGSFAEFERSVIVEQVQASFSVPGARASPRPPGARSHRQGQDRRTARGFRPARDRPARRALSIERAQAAARRRRRPPPPAAGPEAMPVIVETAYPRLSPTPTDAELETWFTPTPADLAFADQHSQVFRLPASPCWCCSRPSSAWAISPGSPRSHPDPVAGRPIDGTGGNPHAPTTSHRKRLMARIRAFLDVSAFDAATRRM